MGQHAMTNHHKIVVPVKTHPKYVISSNPEKPRLAPDDPVNFTCSKSRTNALWHFVQYSKILLMTVSDDIEDQDFIFRYILKLFSILPQPLFPTGV